MNPQQHQQYQPPQLQPILPRGGDSKLMELVNYSAAFPSIMISPQDINNINSSAHNNFTGPHNNHNNSSGSNDHNEDIHNHNSVSSSNDTSIADADAEGMAGNMGMLISNSDEASTKFKIKLLNNANLSNNNNEGSSQDINDNTDNLDDDSQSFVDNDDSQNYESPRRKKRKHNKVDLRLYYTLDQMVQLTGYKKNTILTWKAEHGKTKSGLPLREGAPWNPKVDQIPYTKHGKYTVFPREWVDKHLQWLVNPKEQQTPTKGQGKETKNDENTEGNSEMNNNSASANTSSSNPNAYNIVVTSDFPLLFGCVVDVNKVDFTRLVRLGGDKSLLSTEFGPSTGDQPRNSQEEEELQLSQDEQEPAAKKRRTSIHTSHEIDSMFAQQYTIGNNIPLATPNPTPLQLFQAKVNYWLETNYPLLRCELVGNQSCVLTYEIPKAKDRESMLRFFANLDLGMFRSCMKLLGQNYCAEPSLLQFGVSVNNQI